MSNPTDQQVTKELIIKYQTTLTGLPTKNTDKLLIGTQAKDWKKKIQASGKHRLNSDKWITHLANNSKYMAPGYIINWYKYINTQPLFLFNSFYLTDAATLQIIDRDYPSLVNNNYTTMYVKINNEIVLNFFVLHTTIASIDKLTGKGGKKESNNNWSICCAFEKMYIKVMDGIYIEVKENKDKAINDGVANPKDGKPYSKFVILPGIGLLKDDNEYYYPFLYISRDFLPRTQFTIMQSIKNMNKQMEIGIKRNHDVYGSTLVLHKYDGKQDNNIEIFKNNQFIGNTNDFNDYTTDYNGYHTGITTDFEASRFHPYGNVNYGNGSSIKVPDCFGN